MAATTAATTTTTTNISSPLPSPAADSGGSDSDTLTIILGFSALLLIPVVIYAFFFALKCPPNPLEWRRRRRSARLDGELTNKSGHAELVYSSVAYKKEGTAIDKGGECPVCLSVLNFEGDEVRQLHVCKHTFHVACIDMWLSSHSNCPVCRASIGSKRSNRPVVEGEDDLRQGLPDSSSLV